MPSCVHDENGNVIGEDNSVIDENSNVIGEHNAVNGADSIVHGRNDSVIGEKLGVSRARSSAFDEFGPVSRAITTVFGVESGEDDVACIVFGEENSVIDQNESGEAGPKFRLHRAQWAHHSGRAGFTAAVSASMLDRGHRCGPWRITSEAGASLPSLPGSLRVGRHHCVNGRITTGPPASLRAGAVQSRFFRSTSPPSSARDTVLSRPFTPLFSWDTPSARWFTLLISPVARPSHPDTRRF
jgi:hypothetical protein